MPSYTLYYFNGRGRAEVIRMIFAIADISYNDKRIDFQDWNTFRTRMPCSCLPVLELENKIQIPQSMAIARYLSREFGYYGKNNLEMARIDYICDSLYDIFNDFMRMFYDKEGRMMSTVGADMRSRAIGESSEMRQMYTETCRRILPFLEKTLEMYNNGNKFFMGEEMTLADMKFFASLENPLQENPNMLSSYPKLTALRKRVAAHPKISAYMKRRHLTDF